MSRESARLLFDGGFGVCCWLAYKGDMRVFVFVDVRSFACGFELFVSASFVGTVYCV